MFLATIFLITIILSVIFTKFFIWLANELDIVDKPVLERKIHKQNTPLLGGFAIYFSFFIVVFFLLEKLVARDLDTIHWISFFAGATFLMIGGYIDDKYSLKPGKQIIFPILAIISVMLGGIGIEKITNPFGGLLYIDKILLIPHIFTLAWLLGMMYTTKLLDGIDGLVCGVTGIGGFIIFLFTMTTKYFQPDIGLAALIFSASCLGFLIFNWNPAKIFLGEGGSLLLGYILGVLAIISGGKIAIALLVMGIPILDVAWTIIRRTAKGKNPFSFSDKLHLHHRLLNIGFGQRKTALLYYLVSLIFGLSALFLQSMGKIIALILLFVLMIIIVISLNLYDKKIQNN